MKPTLQSTEKTAKDIARAIKNCEKALHPGLVNSIQWLANNAVPVLISNIGSLQFEMQQSGTEIKMLKITIEDLQSKLDRQITIGDKLKEQRQTASFARFKLWNTASVALDYIKEPGRYSEKEKQKLVAWMEDRVSKWRP